MTNFEIIIGVAFSNGQWGKYTYEEKAEVASIATWLGVNSEQIDAIEKYVNAVRKAVESDGANKDDLKKLGGDVAAGLAAAGVPIGAVAISGTVMGLSAAGITSGLAALGLGFGMATGSGVVASIGVASYFGVKWLYKKLVEE